MEKERQQQIAGLIQRANAIIDSIEIRGSEDLKTVNLRHTLSEIWGVVQAKPERKKEAEALPAKKKGAKEQKANDN